METFTLWHHHYDKEESMFSFYASWVQAQRIHRGTKKMVRQMLDDMGLEKIDFESWKLSHVATDYVSDNRDSDEWRDAWMDTCDIQVKTKDPVRYKPDPPGFAPTNAADDTWDGEFDFIPDRCVVIAEFAKATMLKKALATLSKLATTDDEGFPTEDLAEIVPDLFVQDLRREWQAQRHAREPSLTVMRPNGFPLELQLQMRSDKDFFEGGARLAVLVEQICQHLGADTSWRDAELAADG